MPPKAELQVLPGRTARASPARREHHLSVIDNREDFQRAFLPHLDVAYNLARWLLRNDADAQDVVQEAYLRALRFSGNFRGGDPRAWLLAIVRNAAYTWMSRNRREEPAAAFEEEHHSAESPPIEINLIRKADAAALRAAMEQLPVEFREMIVLRDLEGFSYKEIAALADLPLGTVMSRLARARNRLKLALQKSFAGGSR